MAKILLVEDDKSLREIYGVRLMAEGYEIVSAGDGEEALAMAIKERPDLIVSDVMMPKISGFDMLDILRSTSETKDVKVIMMTALSSDDQRARGESLGADRYLVKSQVGIEDVVRTVHDVLGDGIGAAAPIAATPAPAEPAAVAPAAIIDTPAQAPAPLPPAPAVVASAPIPDPAPAANGLVIPTIPDPVVTPAQAPEPFIPAPAPAPQPVVDPNPAFASAYAAPAPAPIPSPIPDPIAPAPVAPAPFPPQPVAPSEPPALIVTPPAPAPVAPVPGTLSELPANPAPLPQPTAPFSSPAPASLGERVIEPLTKPDPLAGTDIAFQMEQALSGNQLPPNQGNPPVPPLA